MRRQDRYIVNGILWGAGLTALSDILIQWLEHKNRDEELTWENYNGWISIRNATIGGAVGGLVGYTIYCYKISEEVKLPFSTDEYLKKVLTEEHLKANPAAFKNVVAYR